MSIARICKHINCPRYRLPGSDFCDKHQDDQAELDRKREEKKQNYFNNRPRTECEFYRTSRWKNERKTFLEQNPYCCQCGNIATEIHHNCETSDYLTDKDLFFDKEYWVPLCHTCHTNISNRKAIRRPTSLNYSGDIGR